MGKQLHSSMHNSRSGQKLLNCGCRGVKNPVDDLEEEGASATRERHDASLPWRGLLWFIVGVVYRNPSSVGSYQEVIYS